MVRIAWPVLLSQIFAVLSWLPLARRLPSGLKATLEIPDVCPLSARTSLPVAASQSLMAGFSLAQASCLPSGLNATVERECLSPSILSVSLPVLVSQSLGSPDQKPPQLPLAR